jgi:hypothetical protein
VALADLDGSAVLTALTETVELGGMVFGAVYRPVKLIVPTVLFPP